MRRDARNLAAKLAVLLALLASASLAGRAHALLGERGLSLGLALDALAPAAAPTSLELNGARLQLARMSVQASTHELIGRFAAACQGSPPAVAAALLLRRELEDRAGVALCLADLRSRALRFLYVRTDTAGLSQALLAWSDGELPLLQMFPAQGDAAGSDLPDLPRPSGSRRTLSARVQARGYGVAVYQLPLPPAAALVRYAAELERSGFRILHVSPQIAAAVRGKRQVVIQSLARGEQSALAIATLPADVQSVEESTHD